MLGGMDGGEYIGPRAPTLPGVLRSMEPREFTLAAFKSLGTRVTPQPQGLFLTEENGGREHIRFEEEEVTGTRTTLYAPGTAAFQRLVTRVIATGVHEVEDLDQNPGKESEELARRWVLSFGGTPKAVDIEEVHRCFEGKALVRVRATVAHDSYERLVEVSCSPAEHHAEAARSGLGPLSPLVENPRSLGINVDRLADAARLDEAISEFSRFYLERRAQEMQAAGEDERKKKKLEDEFTPRIETTLVALEGKLHRQVKVKAQYRFDAESDYSSMLTVAPHSGGLVEAPELGRCARSGKTVPKTCLTQCQISGALVLKDLLARSEKSSRLALPEFIVRCSLTGKRVLKDEAELSSVSGRPVERSLLKTSALSGKRAEPEHFGRCEFTNAEVLNTELAISDVSGKRYRVDGQRRSAVSGKAGHKEEFIVCHETRHSLTVAEADRCEVTANYVRPGILQPCEITQKRVLPSELERCAVTGKRVLKSLLVTSSLSETRMLEKVAVRSAIGKYCAPIEAKPCSWSGRKLHPDDLRVCKLTGLPICFQFAVSNSSPCLQPLVDLLNGIKRNADEPQVWGTVTTKASAALGKSRCRIEAAVLSPDKQHLAVCLEVRTLLGFRVHQAGLVYSIGEHSVVGRAAQGRRTSEGWSEFKS